MSNKRTASELDLPTDLDSIVEYVHALAMEYNEPLVVGSNTVSSVSSKVSTIANSISSKPSNKTEEKAVQKEPNQPTDSTVVAGKGGTKVDLDVDKNAILSMVLELPMLQEYLDIPELVMCRGVHSTWRTIFWMHLEQYMVHYYRPTTDMVQVANKLLEDCGKWPRFVVLLAELAHSTNRRARIYGIVPPLLQRILMGRALLRGLDDTSEILSLETEAAEYHPWKCLQDDYDPKAKFWEVENCCQCKDKKCLRKESCPPLKCCSVFYPLPLEKDENFGCQNNESESDDDGDEDDDDDEGISESVGKSWRNCYPIRWHEDYSYYSIRRRKPEKKETTENGGSGSSGVDLWTFCEDCNEGAKDGEFRIVQLFMSLQVESCSCPYEPVKPTPAMAVIWYTFLRNMKQSPFIDANADPQHLWSIVKSKRPLKYKEWNTAFEYYDGLELYNPQS